MTKSVLLLLLSVFGFTTQVQAKVWLSEIVADNDGLHLDEDADSEDWIEIFNDATTAVDLSGWSLTDDSAEPKKWVFPPGASIGAESYLVIFASGKNRRISGTEYHTNFKLSRGGEYLGLIRTDGVTEDEFATEFPTQFEGASYGIGQGGGVQVIVPVGADGFAGVPTSAADFSENYQLWNDQNAQNFDGSSWRAIKNGVGFDTGIGFVPWIGEGGNFRNEMWGVNASIFMRLPFNLPSPAVENLTLKMRWDDGFIAYLNGVQVAANQEDTTPDWDSNATSGRTDSLNDDWTYFNIDTTNLNLVAGENILAIHGMNSSRGSSDMIVLTELEGVVPGEVNTLLGYHTTVTPGKPNGQGVSSVPPIIREPTDSADRPVGGVGSTPILITAEVKPGSNPVSRVRLFYQVMFGNEFELVMNDDGTGSDITAGDDIYSANIPTTSLDPGEMIRWRIEASDLDAGSSLAPPYLDPLDADRYFGTVALNSELDSSQLPILETFVQNQTAANTRSGTRTSVYYLGEFYDNVQMDLHGQSTAGAAFPKKSYDLDFNKGNRFLWKEGERRVRDINLLTNWADKSKVRNTMGYEFLRRCGAGHHYAFPVRVERNGEFFSVVDMVEDGDDRYLDRIGLEEDGTLYKMYDKMERASAAVKKSRKELGTEDLADLISNLNTTNSLTSRRRYAYDNVNLAGTVNHLAAYAVIGISDTGHKNYYMYRDTEGDEEWEPLPWDVDLSAGRRWNRTDRYFDDDLFNTLWLGTPNRLWSLINTTSEYRHMVLRRIRSLREQVLLSNSDAASGVDWYSEMVGELMNEIDPAGVTSDGDLDYNKWGSWGNNLRARPAAARILNDWLPEKRSYLFNSARNQNGVRIPNVQPAVPNLKITEIDFLPSSRNQLEEYLIIKNNEGSAMDLSGFTLSGAIEYTFPPGTVVNSGSGTSGSQYQGAIHLAKNGPAFRARATGPTGNEYRYIQNGYQGQFSARGETVELRTATGDLVDSFAYTGTPTPAQQGLRVSEINYHPIDPSAAEIAALPGVTAEDFEFIELVNQNSLPVNLAGAQFTEGIDITIPDGIILFENDRLIIVKNPAAFALRYPGISTTVVGPYSGQLNNDGDTIRLVDSYGENVVVFRYNDRWYPPSDGNGFSLVMADPATSYDAFDSSAAWGSSVTSGGSPGLPDDAALTHYNAWQETNFASELWGNDGHASADPDNDGRPNWREYAFGTDPLIVDDEIFHAEIITDGGQEYLGARVQRRVNTGDLIWTLEAGDDLKGWTKITTSEVSITSTGENTETVVLREESPTGVNSHKFVRLRISVSQ